MKNTITTRLYSLILCASIFGMLSFCLGAEAETESGKFNALLGMLFAEIIIILSLAILFAENLKNK